jgi:hypothetical protein
VRWPPAYEAVIQEAEERPLLVDVTKQCVGEHKSVYDSDL